ncbi:hypothetical protein BU26DRAFT_572686 [Trematosphaeria pertusa]|uniref:Uncharacterized protein n=1 Tax=Trematosphaeria pertusa TaxID=390896 RepID=A0A6A6HR43_9PLEO|nr:uncharacterized protein BU26DRAFT_572686 [Trematosphaeria pertusa]KAF2240501.1 hypothetical protein BU26DRAFT_572686 [Trematosphaeria pertusa]
MATHKLYEADKPEHCSRLESLPREVREKIYFYLGFPVAGHCVHYCDKPCSVHQALRFGQERKRHFEELKRQYEQKKENARWTSYNEGEITKFKEQARIALASNVVTISAIAKGQGLIPGKVSISGVDESRLEHKLFQIPECGLLLANRFFYDDLSACFEADSAIAREVPKPVHQHFCSGSCFLSLDDDEGDNEGIPSPWS